MAKKYITIGMYKKPDLTKATWDNPKAYLSVNLNPNGPQSLVIKKGDIFSFTKQEDKITQLEQAYADSKMKKETFDKLMEMYSDPLVIAEVTLIQKE